MSNVLSKPMFMSSFVVFSLRTGDVVFTPEGYVILPFDLTKVAASLKIGVRDCMDLIVEHRYADSGETKFAFVATQEEWESEKGIVEIITWTIKGDTDGDINKRFSLAKVIYI